MRVRVVFESKGDYLSELEAIRVIIANLGIGSIEALRMGASRRGRRRHQTGEDQR